ATSTLVVCGCQRVGGEPLEERVESLVVVARVSHVTTVARTQGAPVRRGGRRRATAGARFALVQVGDVTVGDGGAGLLHVGQVGQRLRGGGTETGEPGLVAEG